MARDRQLALLFPGQGSQTADMRETVERHRPDLLELALEEVGPDLFERAADGTRWAQPAIYCAALAGDAASSTCEADVMAGHSLGEITALVAAEAIGAEDGLRLVAARGRLMQEAAEETGDGGMTAVRARDGQPRRDRRGGRRGGRRDRQRQRARPARALRRRSARSTSAEALLKERGVRGKRLPVAGAFHSPLMEPAVEPFSEPSSRRSSSPSRACRCIRASRREPFDDVPELLVSALTEPVRWLDVVRALEARGVTEFVETGPGQGAHESREEVPRDGGRRCVAPSSSGRTRGRPCAMPPPPTPQRR